MRELKVEVRDADSAFVDSEIGCEMYVHLRGVDAHVELRRTAIERAYERYKQVEPDAPSTQTAMGLLVLQRAMLAVEDLGAILFALEANPSFPRLLGYRLPQVTAAFDAVVSEVGAFQRTFRLPSRHVIRAEPGLSEVEMSAMVVLLDLTTRRLTRDLVGLWAFWHRFHKHAKKVAHGVGFVAGEHAVDGDAGMVGAQVPTGFPRPFAVALDTTFDHDARSAHTVVTPIDLSPVAVAGFRTVGLVACAITESVASSRGDLLCSQRPFIVPDLYLSELSEVDRNALARVMG